MSFVYIIKRTLHGGLKIWIIFSRGKTIFYSLAALVRKILFCHSKIKFISSRQRVVFDCCAVLWDSCSKADRQFLDNMHRRATSIIEGYKVSQSLISYTFGWPTLQSRRDWNVASSSFIGQFFNWPSLFSCSVSKGKIAYSSAYNKPFLAWLQHAFHKGRKN